MPRSGVPFCRQMMASRRTAAFGSPADASITGAVMPAAPNVAPLVDLSW